MTRVVIPVYPDADMLDICGPFEMFQWAGFEVELVAETPGLIKLGSGLTIKVSADFAAVRPCDALWVPGGLPEALSELVHGPDRSFLKFLRAQAEVATYTCSVCEGAILLAAAELLDGHEVTSHWAFIPYIVEHYPRVKVADGHPRFVLDGEVLTGGGISSGLDEALKLIELLAGVDLARSVQQTTQYYPAPPVASEIPNVITSPMPPWPPKRTGKSAKTLTSP